MLQFLSRWGWVYLIGYIFITWDSFIYDFDLLQFIFYFLLFITLGKGLEFFKDFFVKIKSKKRSKKESFSANKKFNPAVI